jgi:hypothetical protein
VICLIQVGCSQRRAAQVAGVSERVIRYAFKHDPNFRKRMRKARGLAEYEQVQRLQEAGARSWRASAWLLERAFPKKYNLRPKPKTPPPPPPPPPRPFQQQIDALLNETFRRDAEQDRP